MIKRDSKKCLYRVQTNCHISDIGTGLGLGSEFRSIAISAYAEQSRAGFVTYHKSVHHKRYARKNALNNRHGDFCESGIRVCPESVGVGRLCRLRLRLRLREKQPTPTDFDSDSDSAALYGSIWKLVCD